jgi:hypothetical protein
MNRLYVYFASNFLLTTLQFEIGKSGNFGDHSILFKETRNSLGWLKSGVGLSHCASRFWSQTVHFRGRSWGVLETNNFLLRFEPKLGLFRFCFSLYRETKKSVLVFRNCLETNQNIKLSFTNRNWRIIHFCVMDMGLDMDVYMYMEMDTDRETATIFLFRFEPQQTGTRSVSVLFRSFSRNKNKQISVCFGVSELFRN